MTDELEHEVAVLIGHVAGIQQVRVRRIDLEPAVGIAVRLVPDAVRLADRLIDGRPRSPRSLSRSRS
jgi:hypothetical protein